MIPVVGIGAGGHARVLIEILRLTGEFEPVFLLDNDPGLEGKEVMGIRVMGDDSRLSQLRGEGIRHFFVGVGTVRDGSPRQRLYELAHSCGLQGIRIQHPSAIVSTSAVIGDGCCLMPGCVIGTGVMLGNNVIVNSGAVIDHDCIVEDHAHIATGACLASTVRVGMCAHVGVGASIRQCVNIGEFAVVGAGAAVIRDVAAHDVVTGVPAKPRQHSSQGNRN